MKKIFSIMLLLFVTVVFIGCVDNKGDDDKDDNITVTDIKITLPLSTTITQGNTLQLEASLEPKEATNKITWSSSDEDIASVSNTGLVTTVGVGNVKITASVPTGDTVKSASVDLTINPNVRNVLNYLSNEINLEGTYKQIREGSSVTSIESNLNLYFNNEKGHQEYYLKEYTDDGYVDEKHYYGNAKGELVRLHINRLNEVEETNFVHQGSSEYVLFDDFISKFSDIKDNEVKIISPTELEITLTNESAAKDLLYSVSFYETDLTNHILIKLDKKGNPTYIKLEGSYSDTDYDFTYLQTVEYNVVGNINVPERITPFPALEGDDATLVNNFLEALKNRNYALNIFVNDTPTIAGKVTPNNVLMSDANNSSRYFSYIKDKGVFEVSYNEAENSITPKKESSLAGTLDEFLTPIDFSKDLFVPLGDDVYTLLYGLDESGQLIGLDPSIPFFAVYNSIYTIKDLSSVKIIISSDSDKITAISFSYEARLMVYLSYQIRIEITDIGTTSVDFADATVKDYVVPTDWSSLDNEWYENSNTLLDGEINNVPYVHTDWNTFLEEDISLVQSAAMTKEEADALLSKMITLLQNGSWQKTENVYSERSTTIFDGVYGKDGENILVVVDEFTSSSDYYIQIVFLPIDYFVPAASWEEVDSSWYDELSEYLGEDISGVPYLQGDWYVYPKEYDYYYAEVDFDSVQEAEEFFEKFFEELEKAGWYESSDYVDCWYSEVVYENDDYRFYLYIDASINEEREDYYLSISFLNEDEDVEWA